MISTVSGTGEAGFGGNGGPTVAAQLPRSPRIEGKATLITTVSSVITTNPSTTVAKA
jgi:hypothetical protein